MRRMVNIACCFSAFFLFSCSEGKETTASAEVKRSVAFIHNLDTKKVANDLAVVFESVQNEFLISKLFIMPRRHYFLVIDQQGNVLRGGYDSELNFDREDVTIWTDEKVGRVKHWLGVLEENDVVGFDNRSRKNYVRVYVRPNVYLMKISKNAPDIFRNGMKQKVEDVYDYRGDAYFYVSNDVIIATERR